MNDFVPVALPRSALVKAMAHEGRLSCDPVGRSVFERPDLQPDQFMAEPRESAPGWESARHSTVDLLEYRAFEDLRRA